MGKVATGKRAPRGARAQTGGVPAETSDNAAVSVGGSTQDTAGDTSAGIVTRTNQRLSSDQFFSFTKSYEPRAGTLTYVYRLWPVIDRALGPNGPGATKYIAKVAEPIDADWLLRNWGAGDYSLQFTDAAKPRGATQICNTLVKLRSEEHGPVLDRSELVIGDPQNRSYIEGLRARGVEIGGSDEGMSSSNTELAKVAADVIRDRIGNRTPAGPPTQALDVMAEAAKQALQMSNPSAILQTAVALKQLGGGDNNAELIRLLVDSQKQNTELLLKALEKMTPQTSGGSLVSSLEDLVKVQGLMDRLGGRGRGADSWVSQLVQVLPDVADTITKAATAWHFAQVRGGPVPAAPPRGNVLQFPHPAAVDVVEPAPVNTETTEPAAAPAPALPPEAVQAIGTQLLNALAAGRPGDAFAEAVCTMHGDAAYDFVRSMGAAQLLTELQSHADVWAMLAPYETQLVPFLAEFIAYGDDEPAAAPAAPAAPEKAVA